MSVLPDFYFDGTEVGYDVPVIATGAVLQPQETEGLGGEEWGRFGKGAAAAM